MLLRLLIILAVLGLAAPAQARITRLEILRTEPAFGGASFGNTGAYEHVVLAAHGEVDPADPANTIIQDINLAPRNARGMVEYETVVEMRPRTWRAATACCCSRSTTAATSWR
jgi:hypothetical protein